MGACPRQLWLDVEAGAVVLDGQDQSMRGQCNAHADHRGAAVLNGVGDRLLCHTKDRHLHLLR